MTTVTSDIPPPVSAASDEAGPAVIIQPRRGWIAVDWRELIEHRELLFFLVLRDLKVRYKQTVLGVAWALLQPLLTAIIFAIIFGRVAKMPTLGLPPLLFMYAGQWPFQFFSNAVNQSGLSLVNQQALLTKIYLPRLLVPFSYVVGGLVDFLLAGTVMVAMLIYFGVNPGWGLLGLPVLVVVAAAAATGVGLTLAALTVSYRDFRHLVPFMLQTWLFLTPVVYPLAELGPRWRWVLMLNPMTGVIEGFRSALLNQPWRWDALGVSVAVSSVLLVFGVYFFRKTERRFADVV